ncbi:SPRY domain-containing protein [Mesorhizobium sp. CAU 1741]|uniref:SPRY domain-containing protein n=1 Tax=Mesorhizobium sp. CAU 1741 TaxID=3140366 RepID=UPI00325B908C
MILPGMMRPLMMQGGVGFLPIEGTWNPSDKDAAISLSNGNLTASLIGISAARGARATNSASSGRVYWEITTDAGNPYVGLGNAAAPTNTYPGNANDDGMGYQNNGSVRKNGTVAVLDSYTTGDVIGVLVDIDNLKVYFSKNGVWQNSADPDAGTGGIDTMAGPIFPMGGFTSNTILTANFSGPFTYL